MRYVGIILSALVLAACGDAPLNNSSSEDDDVVAGTLKYHCPVTGEDPEGPDVWLELKGTEALLSHSSSFTKASTGQLDPTYKPTLRVNTVRFLGYGGWVPGGTTELEVSKFLEVPNGDGVIFVDTVTTKFTETVYACDYIAPACAASGFAGALATFDLDGQPGNEASVTATSAAKGITASALSRAAAIKPSTSAGSINGSSWGTAKTADATRYYTFTVTPVAGCTLKLDSLALDVRASATGPTASDVATSVDGFATHTSSFLGTSTPTATLVATGSGAIEVRVYGYGASTSAGTFRIQNTMTLSGSIQ